MEEQRSKPLKPVCVCACVCVANTPTFQNWPLLMNHFSFFLPHSIGQGISNGRQLRSRKLYLYVTQLTGSMCTQPLWSKDDHHLDNIIINKV